MNLIVAFRRSYSLEVEFYRVLKFIIKIELREYSRYNSVGGIYLKYHP